MQPQEEVCKLSQAAPVRRGFLLTGHLQNAWRQCAGQVCFVCYMPAAHIQY